MIAFLHTSGVHIERFDKLVRKFDTNTPIKHFVNADLLKYALQNKTLNINGFQKEIVAIKKENPELIICTCSSYGSVCNETNNVKRIDFPIADYLVSNYTKIGIAFTAKSTEKVSAELLQQIANNQKKNIEIIAFDCTKYWKYFENNNIKKYENKIAKKIKKLAPNVDVVFLAQASMEGAKELLLGIKQTIFSSPEFGVKSYLNK